MSPPLEITGGRIDQSAYRRILKVAGERRRRRTWIIYTVWKDMNHLHERLDGGHGSSMQTWKDTNHLHESLEEGHGSSIWTWKDMNHLHES